MGNAMPPLPLRRLLIERQSTIAPFCSRGQVVPKEGSSLRSRGAASARIGAIDQIAWLS
jgi:hypothetical protein